MDMSNENFEIIMLKYCLKLLLMLKIYVSIILDHSNITNSHTHSCTHIHIHANKIDEYKNSDRYIKFIQLGMCMRLKVRHKSRKTV